MVDKAEKWKKFKNAMNEKRTGKQGKPNDPRRNKEEIVVQRLSADVTGKAQKYSCIGPREFVQVGLDDDELKIEKIKDACLKHFAPQTGSNEVTCWRESRGHPALISSKSQI